MKDNLCLPDDYSTPTKYAFKTLTQNRNNMGGFLAVVKDIYFSLYQARAGNHD